MLFSFSRAAYLRSMLAALSIQNFALIDSIDIQLDTGLTVITGETGAGKSILLGALALILGNRADHSALNDQSKKCIVEGEFEIANYKLHSFFSENDLDYYDRTTLRREITPNGKSRSFINDTPVTLDVLRKLGLQLIDIHSQHQSLQINNADFQLEIIDALAGNAKLKTEYQSVFTYYKRISKDLEELTAKAAEARKQEDYLNFQFEELEKLGLTEGEITSLEEEQERFADREDILNQIMRLNHALNAEESGVIVQMNSIKQLFEQGKSYKELDELKARFSEILIELQDIGNEMELQPDRFQYDPERHQIVEERLTEIHRLQQKHQLLHADELLGLLEQLGQQLENLSNYDTEINKLSTELNRLNSELADISEQLSERRLQVLKQLETEVEQSLYLLGIPHADLKVQHKKLESFGSMGLDHFDFLFSANQGMAPQKIAKTASGGEISRLMLSIKSLLAQHKQMPSILFDEIDTGVSGEIAEKMGSILNQIADQRQVISITHLPQIAAKGKEHLYVYKEEGEAHSKTQIKRLNEAQRVEELAKMLSGKSLTEAAINNAKELLAQ